MPRSHTLGKSRHSAVAVGPAAVGGAQARGRVARTQACTLVSSAFRPCMARGVVYLGERAKPRFTHIGRSYRTRHNSHILQQAVSLRTSEESEAFGPVVTMRKLHFCSFAITRLARTRGSSEKRRTSHFSHVRTRFGNCHE